MKDQKKSFGYGAHLHLVGRSGLSLSVPPLIEINHFIEILGYLRTYSKKKKHLWYMGLVDVYPSIRSELIFALIALSKHEQQSLQTN